MKKAFGKILSRKPLCITAVFQAGRLCENKAEVNEVEANEHTKMLEKRVSEIKDYLFGQRLEAAFSPATNLYSMKAIIRSSIGIEVEGFIMFARATISFLSKL